VTEVNPPRGSAAYPTGSSANGQRTANPGDAAMGASLDRGEPKRVPRSPRTAIEPDRVDLPARRSASARHPLIVIGNAVISAFVLVALAAGIALFFGKQRFEALGPLAADRIVNIPRGSGMRDIADILSREGVIDQPWLFIGGVLVLKAREDLKAGEYEFKAHSSMRDVVATIVEGKVVAHQVSIPEGLTSEQIVSRLRQDDVLAGDIKEIPREGSLLPDTYNFARGVTREQMVQRMQQAQQRLLREVWEHRAPDLPLKTPEQLVVLASLVEKETGKPEERTRVAAVFVNRLKQKIRLQSDPTIIYGLVGGKGTLGRPIMKNEIEQPTPYNTYIIDGLPPGPIANPGRASLEAAANPARTRELYFVADGTGGHAFAETYEQHQKNVARLRLIESDQKDQVPISDQLAPPAAQPAPAAAAPPAAPPPRGNVSKPHATTSH
jgi:peptidoglycan lytic transglycosylase G